MGEYFGEVPAPPCCGDVGLQLGLEGLYTGLVGESPEPGEVLVPEKFGDEGL